MSAFPDWVYKFTPRDEQVTPLEILNLEKKDEDTNTYFNGTVYTVPDDRVLILNSAHQTTYAGAGQTPVAFSCWYSKGGQNVYLLQKNVGTRYNINQQFAQMIVAPGAVIYHDAEFSAALNNNILWTYLNGILIPRGNFAI